MDKICATGRLTIYDIAHQAGVSTKTVSKVLNDKPGVSSTTRERIKSLVTNVGYHPHHGARTLRGKHRNCIGVTIVPPLYMVPLSHDFLLWFFAKLTTIFADHGPYLSFDVSSFNKEGNKDYARGVWQQLYDVCVIVGPIPSDDTELMRIHQLGMPYLTFGRLASFPECSSATVNLEQGAYESTRFLIERGHRRIALLSYFQGYNAGQERYDGYVRALHEAGLPVDPALIRSVDPAGSNFSDSVFRLLAEDGVTALIDSTVMMDGEALRAGAHTAGRRFGESVELVCWTYEERIAVVREASAHLWLPVRQASTEGLERLARWSSGESSGPIKVLYNPVLFRESFEKETVKSVRISDLLR